MSRRRHWYHCSATNHGQTFVARRRAPLHASKAEPPVPRLCVCPTVPACFAAAFFNGKRDVYVYRTAEPRRAVKPRNVWDQVITSERWLIPPVSMVLVKTIERQTVCRISEAIHAYHSMTRSPSSCALRVAQYAIAIDVLGGTEWESGLVTKMREIWEIEDPETYILQRAFEESAA